MYKNGFKFIVTKNGIIGEIVGVSTKKNIYTVWFYKNDSFHLMADVFETTIFNNLMCGVYKEF